MAQHYSRIGYLLVVGMRCAIWTTPFETHARGSFFLDDSCLLFASFRFSLPDGSLAPAMPTMHNWGDKATGKFNWKPTVFSPHVHELLIADDEMVAALRPPRPQSPSPRWGEPDVVTADRPRQITLYTLTSDFPEAFPDDDNQSFATGSSELPYSRPTYFSGLGHVAPLQTSYFCNANVYRPGRPGEPTWWNTAPVPRRANELPPKLALKTLFPIQGHERTMPCWKDCPLPPGPPPRPVRRNPIHDLPFDECIKFPSPRVSETNEHFGLASRSSPRQYYPSKRLDLSGTLRGRTEILPSL